MQKKPMGHIPHKKKSSNDYTITLVKRKTRGQRVTLLTKEIFRSNKSSFSKALIFQAGWLI